MANEQNLTPFKPGNNANPNGRPKKFVSAVLDELKAEGYENIKRSQIVDVYETLLVLPESKLRDIVSGEQPMIYRIIAKEMLSKRGFDVIERMLDRTQGKPTQALDLSGGVEIKPGLTKEQEDKIDEFDRLESERIARRYGDKI